VRVVDELAGIVSAGAGSIELSLPSVAAASKSENIAPWAVRIR
jgi:hypothetical protein